MPHIVHCRICHQPINRDIPGDWMRPSTNYYYHIKCYDDWVGRKKERAVDAERTDDEWFDLLKDYIYRDIKLPNIDWNKVVSQWKNFIRLKKYTPKGMYFAVIYFYEVRGNKTEGAQGGIGIIPSIYNDAAEYWVAREKKQKGVLEEIVRQMEARRNRNTLTINEKPKSTTKKIKFSLDDIGVEEDDG